MYGSKIYFYHNIFLSQYFLSKCLVWIRPNCRRTTKYVTWTNLFHTSVKRFSPDLGSCLTVENNGKSVKGAESYDWSIWMKVSWQTIRMWQELPHNLLLLPPKVSFNKQNFIVFLKLEYFTDLDFKQNLPLVVWI